jgi:FkbM family methyltransferase
MLYFDIGANVGNWTLSNINTADKIITIEASPITFEKLKLACKNDKISLLNYAVCNNNGNDIVFYHADCDTISTLNKDWLTSSNSRFNNFRYTEITCKTITIDKLIELYGVPDLIKIDVEGGEFDCVSSLNRKVDTLCFEWASETNNITFKCLDHLFSLGFNKFYLQDKDDYTFRPIAYYSINDIKSKLMQTIPKVDWGMLWCK